MKEEKATLTIETINKVIQYLAQRPYVEVADLIAEVRKAEIIKEEE